jgi:hypothetical protein
MRKRINPCSIFTLAIIMALVLPVLLQDGMFMDGVQYACVSRNLANGNSTFWFPWLHDAWIKSGSSYFMEHPPLVYGIQSVFFNVFGDTMYTERIYSLCTLLFSAYLISRIWKLVHPKQEHTTGWLPVLLWIITPVCFWSYQNNMQENTMGIFTLWAIFFILKGLISNPRKTHWFIWGGLAVFAAFLCKGLPGFFPVVTVVLYFLCFKTLTRSRMLFYTTVVILSSTGTLVLLILFHEPAADSLNFYFYERLSQRIVSEPTVESRFFILQRLFTELIPMMIILVVVGLRKYKQITIEQKRWALFFCLLGLSASLPMFVTTVQRGFYLVPAFPFFALAAATLLKNRVEKAQAIIDNRYNTTGVLNFVSSCVLLWTIAPSIAAAGFPGREVRDLEHAEQIANAVGKNTTVCATPDIYFNWSLHFYLLRKYNITLNYKTDVCEACLRGKDVPVYENYSEKKYLAGGDIVLYKMANSINHSETLVMKP